VDDLLGFELLGSRYAVIQGLEHGRESRQVLAIRRRHDVNVLGASGVPVGAYGEAADDDEFHAAVDQGNEERTTVKRRDFFSHARA